MSRTSCACTRTLRGLADPRCAPRLELVQSPAAGVALPVRAKFRFIAISSFFNITSISAKRQAPIELTMCMIYSRGPPSTCFKGHPFTELGGTRLAANETVQRERVIQTKPHINAALNPHLMEMNDEPTACSCVLALWSIHLSAASASLLNALLSFFHLVALRPILIARF